MVQCLELLHWQTVPRVSHFSASLYRQFYNHGSPETLKQLYLSLVRPHLEYAAPLWSPYTQKDINSIENVQKFATKLITHHWDQSYAELLELTNLPTLSSRQTHFKLHQVYIGLSMVCVTSRRFSSRVQPTAADLQDHICYISPLHTQMHTYILLFQVLWLRGTDLLNSKYLQVVFQP